MTSLQWDKSGSRVSVMNLSWSAVMGGYSSVHMCVYLEEKLSNPIHFAHSQHLATAKLDNRKFEISKHCRQIHTDKRR